MQAASPTPLLPIGAGADRPRCEYHCLLIGSQGDLARRLVSEFPDFGVRLTLFADPRSIVGIARAWRFDAVLIDARSADRRRPALVRAFAGKTALPVLLLSHGTDESAAIIEIERGAADVLAAQASSQLIATKVKRLASLAREPAGTSPVGPPQRQPDGALRVGRLHLDLRNQSATVGGVALHLPARAFAVLAVLARHIDLVIDRTTLALQLGARVALRSRALDMQVHRIRMALMDADAYDITIDTVYRRGYRLGLRRSAETDADAQVLSAAPGFQGRRP